jgi:S1-C subfamily serine protease
MFTARFKSRYAGWVALVILIAPANRFAVPAPTPSNSPESAGATAARAQAQPDKSPPLSPDARGRVRKAVAAVGLILVRNFGDNSNPRPRGSGVVVRADGVVATNNHVITDRKSNSAYDEIFFAPSSEGGDAARSKPFLLKTLLVDKDSDLALLRVERGGELKPAALPFVEMGDSKSAQLLDELVIIGFPEKGGTTVTLSQGVIEGKDILGNWIKTDARVIHGNSGGAAVNAEGKLIGIPTKVEADDQEIDRDGDGFPDARRRYGAVGFLRPAHLVAAMIAQLDNQGVTAGGNPVPNRMTAPAGILIKGVVRSAASGKPLAGVLVGLVPLGTVKVSEASLLTWGSSGADGVYKLNKPVPPGKYTLKAKALGHAAYSRDVEISQGDTQLVIEMSLPPAR